MRASQKFNYGLAAGRRQRIPGLEFLAVIHISISRLQYDAFHKLRDTLKKQLMVVFSKLLREHRPCLVRIFILNEDSRVKLIGFNSLRFAAAASFVRIALLFLPFPHLAFAKQADGQSSNRHSSTRASAPALPFAPTSTPTHRAHPASSSAASQPVLAQFAWLEGEWRADWGSRSAEQSWLESKAGELVGIARITEGEKTLVLELFSLFENSEGVQLYLRHFTPELLPWEKSDATTLKLAAIDATKAVFVNSINGEPRRAIFTRLDADTYTARSELEPAQGEAQVIEITFHRQKPPAAPTNAGS